MRLDKMVYFAELLPGSQEETANTAAKEDTVQQGRDFTVWRISKNTRGSDQPVNANGLQRLWKGRSSADVHNYMGTFAICSETFDSFAPIRCFSIVDHMASPE